MSFPEFRIDPTGAGASSKPEIGPGDKFEMTSPPRLELRDECRNCDQGRLRLTRAPVFPTLIGFARVVKIIGIVLFVLALVQVPGQIRQIRQAPPILIGMFLFPAVVWSVGRYLSRTPMRYRCELCGTSISKEEFLARSSEARGL